MLKYDGYSIVLQEVPDEISLAINITGCPYACDGCHSPHLQEDRGKPVKEDIFRLIEEYKDQVSCICFMGGDYAPEELAKLIVEIRMFCNLKIALYCGDDNPSNVLWLLADYIKIGHYDKECGGLSDPNTNQRMYKLYSTWYDITDMFQPRKDL